MALKQLIENANALGRQNLNAKGITTDGTETTYQIMGKIAEIQGGGSNDTQLKELVEGTLTELVDDTITVVGSDVFYGNKNIQSVSLPNCVTLKKLAFDNCTKLTSVYLPKCATVGESAFYGCQTLERIDLPSVTSISAKAFYSCLALATLIIRTNQVVPAGATSLFEGAPIKKGTGFIYVPDNLVEDYKAATTWSTYANQIKGLSELPE